jgi:predicted transcriptional regulator
LPFPGAGFFGPDASTHLRWLLVGSALLLLPFLLLYHRIERSRLLSSERRRAVLAFVKAHPGATAADVAAALGVYYNAARHHLDLLAGHGFLTRRRAGSTWHYFEPTGRWGEAEERAVALAGRQGSAGFLRLVAAQPGLRQKEAAERLGLAKSTVSERVRVLEAAGLLRAEGGALALTEQGRAAVAALPQGPAGPRLPGMPRAVV